LWRGDGEALGQLRLPQEIADETDEYCLHPALLDACLQTMAGVWVGSDEALMKDHLYLPVHFDSYRLHQRPPGDGALWCHAALRTAELEYGTGDIFLTDEQGGGFAEVTGLKLERLNSALQANVTDWFYRLAWEQCEGAPVHQTGQAESTVKSRWLILADD